MLGLVRRHLSTIAVAFVTAAVTAGGPALAAAFDAINADKVDNRHAVGAGATSDERKGKLVATSPTTGRLPNDIIAKAPNADRLGGLNAAAFSRRLKRTVVVNGSGTAAENGAALRTAINSIPTDSTGPAAGREWLVLIGPGKFGLGGMTLDMRDYVNLEGAGADATVIQCNCGTTVSEHLSGAVRGAMYADLTDLTIRNDGVADEIVSAFVQVVGTASEMSDVSLISYGEVAFGAWVANSGTLRIDDSWVAADSLPTGTSHGVMTDNGSVRVHGSRLDGFYSIGTRNTGSVRAANSQIIGGVDGSATCVASYNSAYAELGSNCEL